LKPSVPTIAIRPRGIQSCGVARTYRRPARTAPARWGSTSAGRNASVSIPANATIMTAKVAALSAKHGSTPTVAIRIPASAGPTMRAVWISTLLRLTAFTTRPAPTISTTNACRVG
jgi:hypothetical protein